MRKRADHVNRTRQRIIEVTVRLHGNVGPAATTIARIAEEAGVTRATVYRHFPDDEALFGACSAHWLAQQQPPDTDAWATITNADERLRVGLRDLYRFYRDGEQMLTGVHRDKSTLPATIQRSLDDDNDRYRGILLQPFDVTGAARRRVVSLIGHAVSFWTWRSLCVEQGLFDREAVDAMVRLIVDEATGSSASGR